MLNKSLKNFHFFFSFMCTFPLTPSRDFVFICWPNGDQLIGFVCVGINLNSATILFGQICITNKCQLATKVSLNIEPDVWTYPAIDGESSLQLNIFFTFGRGFSASTMMFVLFSIASPQHKLTSQTSDLLPCSEILNFKHWKCSGDSKKYFFINDTPGCNNTLVRFFNSDPNWWRSCHQLNFAWK